MNSKQVAINVAKQAARESNEVLKEAGEQILSNRQVTEEQEKPIEKPQQDAPKPKNLSFLNEYRRELEEIEKQTKYEELVKKIQSGEEVPLTNYANEFSIDQMQVLKAQMEAVAMQKKAMQERKQDSFPQIITKRARGMMGTIKKRNQQHVEMRQPPSG